MNFALAFSQELKANIVIREMHPFGRNGHTDSYYVAIHHLVLPPYVRTHTIINVHSSLCF